MPVCGSCKECALDEGADSAMAEDVMRQMGLDLPDHLCEAVETNGQTECGCQCRQE